MKRFDFLRGFALIIFALTCFIFTGAAKTVDPTVTFYKVPLVCSAAPNIGCGSRSKPVLLEMEKNPAIKEAWLNRSGTIVAVVWKGKPQTESVTKPIFAENELSYKTVSSADATSYLKTFRKPGLWYRGADVDMLSREEAATIANSAVKFALAKKLITEEEAKNIRTDVEAYFKTELVKIRTEQQLNEDDRTTFKEALYRIGEKYIGKERTQKVMELYKENQNNECKKDSTCTDSEGKEDCCRKKKNT